MVSPKDIEKKVESNSANSNSTTQEFEEGTSLLSDSLRKFKKNKMAVVSCITITLLFTASLLAQHITPYGFDEGDLEIQNFPPTWYKVFMSEGHKKSLTEWAAADTSAEIGDGFEDFDEAIPF